MKKVVKKFEAVRFTGPDPASSPFARLATNSLTEAKAFVLGGPFFGYVVNTDTGTKIIDYTAKKGT